mmetsp:Transcript_2436/g.3923  ORF Transcript_2436/g.3923 Transcript_2436/m.3923 type:complete len:289 (+) Transcript_2436:292-1158(+)
MRLYFWWDLVLHNKNYEEHFANALGRDELGIIKVWQELGNLLFVPVDEITEMVKAIEATLVPNAYKMAIHVRMGGNWYDQADEGRQRNKKLPLHVAQCALAVVPFHLRNEPINYLIVSDNADAKNLVRYIIATAEDNEEPGGRLDTTAESALDALGVQNASLRHWLKRLQVKVYRYKSGSRVVVVNRQAARNETVDIQQALAEVYALGLGDRLVRTTGSTFCTAAYAMFPKPTFYVLEKELTCHAQATMEPIVFGNSEGVIATIVQHGRDKCFRAKEMTYFPWLFTAT